MTLDQVMSIYTEAIEPTTPAAGGLDWWLQVQKEVEAVVAAPSNVAAASFIDWWHHDWRQVEDSPTRAAGRIRKAAAKILTN